MRALLVLLGALPIVLAGCTGSRRVAETPVAETPVAEASVAEAYEARPPVIRAPGDWKPAPARPGCEALTFDVGTGLINGLAPTASMEEVKQQFPCWTGETEEGHAFNNGGGVFYTDHDMYFYTHRDYVEVRDPFSGTVTPPVLGGHRDALEAVVGLPVRTERYGGGTQLTFYPTAYGCLGALLTPAGLITELRAYAHACDEVELED